MNIIELVRSIADKDKVDPWTGQEDMATLDRHELELLCATVREQALEESAKACDAYADKCIESESWEAEDVSLINAAAIRRLK